MNQTVEQIVETEWAMFDKVHNRGGRAACQDDRDTFFLMRTSQLMAWSADMQESYLADLREAARAGRNPLSEKYGYMMARTSPAEFAQIQDRLIDGICAAHVAWLETLSARYPHLTGRGRPIRRQADSLAAPHPLRPIFGANSRPIQWKLSGGTQPMSHIYRPRGKI
ncbi:MAG: DUF4125 family protein [Butyricicoccus sp.]|nr:DUF4125 family protein [Butyricicoccus sp.]